MASSVGAVVALGLLLATSAFAQVAQQNDVNAYTCPVGFVPYQRALVGGGPGGQLVGNVTCIEDPCYKDVCGPGNSCQLIYRGPSVGPSPSSSPPSSVNRQCICQAPGAVSISGGAFCYVPGSDPCSPNPCHNGGQCIPRDSRAGNGEQGTYYCQCPSPYNFVGPTCDVSSNSPSPTLKSQPAPQPAPQGSQGVCGSGAAADFSTRCWFNNDPAGRYVCCDSAGCNGFDLDNSFPRCQANGYVPPSFGVAAQPVAPPPSTDQGVCGTGDAGSFPVRCWFNNDPQGRYVCCDGAGCDGFNPPSNFFPHCKNNGFVPPGMV